LAKIDQLDVYIAELKEIVPRSYAEYQKVEKKRACERLLQVSIEVVIDICNLLVSGLRLGLPAEEEDLFRKLLEAAVLSEEMGDKLREMRGFRNILVHEYAQVDDKLVYEAVKTKLKDFALFRREVLAYLKQ
jgi:uncharacterized protein YutE (UPF0331/DUF86 family)